MHNRKSSETLGIFAGEEIQEDAHLVEVLGLAKRPIEEPVIAIQGLRDAIEHHKKGALTALVTATGGVGFVLGAYRAAHREVQINV